MLSLPRDTQTLLQLSARRSQLSPNRSTWLTLDSSPFVDLTEQGYDSDTNSIPEPLTIEDLVGPAATLEPFSDDESTINPAGDDESAFGDDSMAMEVEYDLEDGFQTPIRDNNTQARQDVIPDPPVLTRTHNNNYNYRNIVNTITPPETYNMILPLYNRLNDHPHDENRAFGHQPVVRNLVFDF